MIGSHEFMAREKKKKALLHKVFLNSFPFFSQMASRQEMDVCAFVGCYF